MCDPIISESSIFSVAAHREMDVSRDADIYNFFLGMWNTPEKDWGQKEILQFSTLGLFSKQCDSCSYNLLQPSKPKRHNDFSSLEYFMTWILWMRKQIKSCKKTKTLKKFESHLKKERRAKLASAHTSGSFSSSAGLSKQQTINPLTCNFFVTKTCAVLS